MVKAEDTGMILGVRPIRAICGIVLGLLACWLAYRAGDDARYAFLLGTDAVAAHDARPSESVSLAKFLDRKLGEESGSTILGADLRIVRTAIEDAPISRSLLRIIASKAEMAGDIGRADAAMSLSNALSRRDALAQLWLIERSVGKDDMNGAVRHYHAALSVHPELGAVLFPILSRAIAYPEVRSAIAPYIARQARWSVGLLSTALSQGKPSDVAQLVLPIASAMRGGGYEAINASLITRLAESGDFVKARKVAEAIIPHLNISGLSAFGVNDTTIDGRAGVLAWILADGDGLLATPNGLGGFDVEIGPLARGVVASRIVPVGGGKNYTFSQTVRGMETEALAHLFWQAFCLPAQSKAAIWQEEVPAVRKIQRTSWTITVPASCSGLNFVLSGRGPDGQQPARFAFEAFVLKTALD